MIKRIKNLLACLAVLMTLFSPAVVMAAAPSSGSNDQVFGACDQAPDSPVCKTTKKPTQNPAVHLINVAADVVAAITGIAAVIIIIVGGFNFITAGGDAEKVASSRKHIMGALTGLVIVALAWAIIR